MVFDIETYVSFSRDKKSLGAENYQNTEIGFTSSYSGRYFPCKGG